MSERAGSLARMVVLSNRQLGPGAELWVSPTLAREIVREVVDAARATARDHWEHELVRWLAQRAAAGAGIDVGEIAWSPEHFDAQRQFVTDAIDRAAACSRHGVLLVRWRALIDAHPRAFVQFGRRWNWRVTA
jgi:hypothetical protein